MSEKASEEVKTVPMSASAVRLSRVTNQLDASLYGEIHGGAIMRFIDETAGVIACRFSGGRAATVAVDEMQFMKPVLMGDVITCEGQVNWTGRTSFEVGMRVTAQPFDQGQEAFRHVATAYLVFVALDDSAQPRVIPQVLPETDEDWRRFRGAEIRRNARRTKREALQRLREGADSHAGDEERSAVTA